MARLFLSFSVFCFTMALSGLTQTVVADQALTDAEVFNLFSEKTADVRNSKRQQFVVNYNGDGTAKFRMKYGQYRDSGTWGAEDGQYCATWRKTRQGRKVCWKATRKTDGSVFLESPSGSVDSYIVVDDGDGTLTVESD